MKHKFISMVIIAVLAVSVWGAMPVKAAPTATTYYSQGSLPPDSTSSWNTGRNAGGSSPADFASGDVFVIQNGHNMTTSAAWNISGTGSKLWIENGGTLTADFAVTLATGTNFQIDAGGTYVHNNTTAFGSSIFRGTESFDAASTVILSNSNTTGPSSVAFGNLTINFTSDPGGAVHCDGGLTTINGNLTLIGTSTREFHLVANTPSGSTYAVGKDLIIQGGTFNVSSGTATATLNIGGNFNQTGGTFTSAGVTTVVFTGGSSSVTFSTSGGTFTNTNLNWQIAAGKTVALNTNFGAGSWVASGRTMTVNGAFQINDGTWPGSAGTWTYGAAGTLIFNNTSGSYGLPGSIDATHVYWPGSSGPFNVNVLGAGGITLGVARTVGGTFQTAATVTNGGNLTLNGIVQINSGGWFASAPVYGPGSTLVYNSGSYGISNEWPGSNGPHNVTIQNNTAVTWASGSRSVPGDFTLSSGSLTLGGTIGDDLYVGGNWINDGAFNANNRTVTFSGGSHSIDGTAQTTFAYLTVAANYAVSAYTDFTVDYTLTLDSGAYLYDFDHVITVKGNVANSGVHTSATGKILLTGGTAPHQLSGGGTYGNLELDDTTGAVLSGADTIIAGDLVITQGPLEASAGALTVAGNWVNNGTFVHNSGTVTFNGVSDQTISGSSRTDFNVLTINSGAVVVVPAGLTQPHANTANNNGTLRQAMTVNSGTGQFLRIKNVAGSADTYFGVDIATANTVSITVSVSGNQPSCPNALGFPVKRCFEITPENQVSADVKFYYTPGEMQLGQTFDNLRVWHYNNATHDWDGPFATANGGGCTGVRIDCYVQADGINSYSPFVLKVSAPTAVNLASFTATPSADHNLIAWETASELHNLGFNLWRGISASAPDVKLNEYVIPSQAPGGTEGFAYSYDDFDITSSVTYYYWLEDVDLNGTITRHGPVSTSGDTPTAIMVKDFAASPMTTSPVATSPLLAFGVISAIGLAGLRLRRRK